MDVMVDLECLSRKPNAHILSLGACTMDKNLTSFYSIIGTRDQDRDIENDTIDWWLRQNEEARAEVFHDTGLSLKPVLNAFADWFKNHVHGTTIWSHGSIYDVIILQDAFEQCDIPCPWTYLQVKDTRTAITMAQRFIRDKSFEPNTTGKDAKHNALNDAKYQAQWMCNIFEAFQDQRDELSNALHEIKVLS